MDNSTIQTVSTVVVASMAVVTAIAMIVYVCYTRRLWEETRHAVEHNGQQIEVMRQHMNLNVREMELRMRPYVTVRSRTRWKSNDEGRMRFVLVNKGLTPAHIRLVELRSFLNDDPMPRVEMKESVLFPGGQRKTHWSKGTGRAIKTGGIRWRVNVRVEYVAHAAPWDTNSYVTAYEKKWDHIARAWVNDRLEVV